MSYAWRSHGLTSTNSDCIKQKCYDPDKHCIYLLVTSGLCSKVSASLIFSMPDSPENYDSVCHQCLCLGDRQAFAENAIGTFVKSRLSSLYLPGAVAVLEKKKRRFCKGPCSGAQLPLSDKSRKNHAGARILPTAVESSV